MNSFLSFLIFNASSNVGYAAISLQVVASCLSFMLWIPPILDVFKLNKTYGLSETFLLFAMFAGILFSINGIYLIVDASQQTGIAKIVPGVALGGLTLFLNVFSGTCNFFFWGKKKVNMREAALKGLSEMDYYNNHCAK